MQQIMGCCDPTLLMTPWTFNWHINLSASRQSCESHLYARKPLGYSLTLQSSVNYPVTANLTVISQTIKQAIKLLWIASSGPGRLDTSPSSTREKPLSDPFHVGRFLRSYVNSDLHTFRRLQEYLEKTAIYHNINTHIIYLFGTLLLIIHRNISPY